MKNPDSSGAALAFLAVSALLAACASTAPARHSRPGALPAASAASGAATARPEFPGYKLVIRKGEELFCQKRNPTGSRARVVEACYTREQMRRMAENSQDFFKEAEASSSHDALRMDSPR